MVMLAAIGDAFIREDDASAREHLALALAATEQAASDERWDLAFFFYGGGTGPFGVRPSSFRSVGTDAGVHTSGPGRSWSSHLSLRERNRPADPASEGGCQSLQGPASEGRAGENRKASEASPQISSQAKRPIGMNSGPGAPLPAFANASPFVPPAEKHLSFRAWSMCAHLKFIKTRTPFAAFIKLTLHLSRCGPAPPASVLFPLPLPYPAIFRSRPGLSSRRRAVIGQRRLLHIVVCALNFVYFDFSFVPLELLQRQPNRPQAR